MLAGPAMPLTKQRAEIVERDAHADGAELTQDRQRGVVVADQHRLGDLSSSRLAGRLEVCGVRDVQGLPQGLAMPVSSCRASR